MLWDVRAPEVAAWCLGSSGISWDASSCKRRKRKWKTPKAQTVRSIFSRTDDTRGAEAGGSSPPLLDGDPILCVHSAILARQLSPEMPSGSSGPRLSHLSLLTARWLSGEMTSQYLWGLPWLGLLYWNLSLAPGLSISINCSEDPGIKLTPERRIMIYYLLIYVGLLTWRNWGLRLSHHGVSVLSCPLLK